ncbi:Cro/Cl family transcriptional regulator [Phytophthora palmivora]|uniref:Cro/Cl family transcriptional regulator n=1 Tax=Phytophthora palmivora TaxID=4796 RepID=A0A2P4X525_9STRA|nr:Cro/Cl family transcriptional regulator [Phytophthora palmivora]
MEKHHLQYQDQVSPLQVHAGLSVVEDGDYYQENLVKMTMLWILPINQRPTIAAVDSNNWATAATPFAAFLPRDTITPITSRKSVAAAVLTAPFPPENVKKFDREMIICERKHVKAMGKMATRIYRGNSVKNGRRGLSRKHHTHEKQALKDQIYLPNKLVEFMMDHLRVPPKE